MNRENNDKQLTKTHFIVMAIAIIIALSIFRLCYRTHMQDSEIEMNKTEIQVDGKSYEVHTPVDDNIDAETLKELFNDPETKEFLEETSN